MTGLKKNGTDLDTIFDAYTTGYTKAAATGIDIDYDDLNTVYQNIIYGTAASATGIEKNGSDLNTIFCAKGTSLIVTLPTFPNAFTVTPQPYPSGTSPMTATISHGPGGTYTYSWSYTASGATTFTIHSGQGTNTIQWSATGTSGEPGNIIVYCLVTSNSTSASINASTTMSFRVPGGG
jgi:hypothetical protein